MELSPYQTGINVRFISKNEIDGKVSDILLKTASRFIGLLGSVFNINYMMKGRHGKRSAHGEGLALDGNAGGHVEGREPTEEDMLAVFTNLQELLQKKNKTLFEQAVIARLSGFTGIGIYPHWKKPGLHLDVSGNETFRPRPKAWFGLSRDVLEKKLKETKSSQIYVFMK